MNEFPLVSIIALCYNQARFAEETLNSILAQTYPNIQLIIMDDASADNSVEVINRWIERNGVKCTFIAHKKNKGICKTLNEALTFVEGEYLQMVACDDIYEPEKTSVLVDYLIENPQYSMVYCDASFVDDDSNELYGLFIQRHRNFLELPHGNIFEILLDGNFIPAMSAIIKSDIVRELGGWDENLKYEDFDFWLRLSKLYSIGVLKEKLCKYRFHSHNLHKIIHFDSEKLKIYYKHIDGLKGKEKYQTTFFNLFKNSMISNSDRIDYYNAFKNSKHAVLIKWGIPYGLFKMVNKVNI